MGDDYDFSAEPKAEQPAAPVAAEPTPVAEPAVEKK
jgi:hypothetical protein